MLLGTGLALSLGVPAFAAPAANAAPAATTIAAAPVAAAKVRTRAPHVTVKKSSGTQIRKVSAIKLTVRARSAGKAVAGKVSVKVSGKHVRTVPLRHGVARTRLPKSLKLGRHTVRLTVLPAAQTLRDVVRRRQVRVVSQHQAIVTVAKKYVGVRYVSGGTSPRGFDCSGFTSYVYAKAVHRRLSRTSGGQRHNGHVVSRSRAVAGDIIWTSGHVAIYLGGNRQIDAPRPGKTIQVRAIWQSHPTFIRAV